MAERSEFEVTVKEAYHGDAGRGIARLSLDVMKAMGLASGEVIEIEGKKTTTAVVWPGYPEDSGNAICRIDGTVRSNVGAGIDEKVRIRRIRVGRAQKVVIQPTHAFNLVGVQQLLWRHLSGRPIQTGQQVQVDVLGTRLSFVVAQVVPGGVGIVDEQTAIEVAVDFAERVVVRPTVAIQPLGKERAGVEEYFRRVLRGRTVQQGQAVPADLYGSRVKFVVADVSPQGGGVVGEATVIEVEEAAFDAATEATRAPDTLPDVHYEDIGGLARELAQVREMIELPLRHPEIFERLGIEPPKGVLLYGPPGTGKTLIAKAVASEVDARFLTISGPEIMSKYYGESEAKLRAVWAEAARHAPSIVFLDEIDSIAPKRSEVHGEVERRVVAQLLALMDGLKSRGRVVVIAATNIPDALDPALRRGGRFDREIEIGIPDRKGRLEILRVHTRGVPLADDVDLEAYANQTHGFVGADIALLVKEAAMHALRKRVLPKIRPDAGIPAGLIEGLRVTREDFDAAAKHVEPSAMREVLVEVPDVGWDAIGGLEDAKREIAKAVAWPLQYPDAFARLHMKPPKGILLVGPPGTGKTMIAKAIAARSGLNFISIKGPEILSRGVGDSEKHVREAFRKARQSAPAILFFDEIDAIVQKRGSGTDLSRVTESVLSQLLTELDGIEELKDVVVLAATNRPDVLDPAILRPGRLEKHIAIPPPDEAARKQIFSIYLREVRDVLASDVNIDDLVRRTQMFVGADIEALVREAKMASMEELVASAGRSSAVPDHKATPVIAKRHFEAAFRQAKGTLDSSTLEQFERASWEVLYEKEQRDVLVHAAELLLSMDALAKKREIPKDIRAMAADLRAKVYWQKKSFDQIAVSSQKLAQALGGLLQKR